jgi:KipI family sensor histidine kinase inhibitor
LAENFPDLQPVGDSALLVRLGDRIDRLTNRKVHALAHRLALAGIPGLGECVPGYASLLVHYDPFVCQTQDLFMQVQGLVDQKDIDVEWQPRTIEIPVAYGGEYGPDLGFVAEHNHIRSEEVIRLHSQGAYVVYMMGFMPGFAYLGGLNPRIAAPRLATPRSRIPAGSVGIAGEQTGVYPLESPGGWRIIGQTFLNLFDPRSGSPFLLAPGDSVHFIPLQDASDGA